MLEYIRIEYLHIHPSTIFILSSYSKTLTTIIQQLSLSFSITIGWVYSSFCSTSSSLPPQFSSTSQIKIQNHLYREKTKTKSSVLHLNCSNIVKKGNYPSSLLEFCNYYMQYWFSKRSTFFVDISFESHFLSLYSLWSTISLSFFFLLVFCLYFNYGI